jgi:hypothetical protein
VVNGSGTSVYKVKIALASNELGRANRRAQVKLGMTGRVEIVIAEESLLSLLVKKLHRTISLG